MAAMRRQNSLKKGPKKGALSPHIEQSPKNKLLFYSVLALIEAGLCTSIQSPCRLC